MSKITTIWGTILFLTLTTLGQTYSTHPAPGDRDTVRRFHLGMYYFDPGFNTEQRDLILRAIRRPTKDMEAEGRTLFTPSDFINIFAKIGTRDITAYKTVFAMNVLADKKRFVTGLSVAQKAAIWRTHFAYILATKDLTDVQLEFLNRLSAEMDAPNLDKIKKLGDESVHFFNKDVGTALFATIGPYTSIGTLCKNTVTKSEVAPLDGGGDCVCAIDHYNWSCTDTCGGAGTCNVVDGCGVLWMYSCSGSCKISEDQ